MSAYTVEANTNTMQETVIIALYNENLRVHVEHEVSGEVLAYIEMLEQEVDKIEEELLLVKDVFVDVSLELNTTLNLQDITHSN
jgi:hypothetical protein